MHIASILYEDKPSVGVKTPEGLRGFIEGERGWAGDILHALKVSGSLLDLGSELAKGQIFDSARISFRPPLQSPPKTICIGLNYASHTGETIYDQPDYPTIFGRFASSLIGHDSPMILPQSSHQLDYEGEMAVVIGKGGRHITRDRALEHVAGYSIFNDGSIRDFQFKSPQWTIGKNFDGTGAFGPFLVTPDELPTGAAGLQLTTRLNGVEVQSANTSELIFDVATLIVTLSEAVTLEPGDVIVSGTPSGIGHAKKPPLYMKAGDVCEVEIEGLGVLRNVVTDEASAAESRIAA